MSMRACRIGEEAGNYFEKATGMSRSEMEDFINRINKE